MPLRNADRVLDTSTTTGTGNFTVSGTAASSYITFSQIPSIATNDTFWYCIAHQSANEYETGLGTWQGSNAFARTIVFQSSNSNALVNFSAGTKNCMVAPSSAVTRTLGRFHAPVPALADFTWVNQGTASAAQVSGTGTPIMVTLPDQGVVWSFLVVTPPSTPYSAIAYLRGQIRNISASGLGMYFYATGSTKMLGIEQLSGGEALRVEKMNSPTSDNSTAATVNIDSACNITGGLWTRLRNDGSTLYLDYSHDGYNFTNLFNEAVGTFISPDRVGFGGAVASTGITGRISLSSWSIVPNATA